MFTNATRYFIQSTDLNVIIQNLPIDIRKIFVCGGCDTPYTCPRLLIKHVEVRLVNVKRGNMSIFSDSVPNAIEK